MLPRTSTTLLHALKAQPNDERAWRRFAATYGPAVLRLATRNGLTEAEADDVLSDTLLAFLSAYREGAYERERGRLRAWVCGIAMKKILQLRRTAARVLASAEVHRRDARATAATAVASAEAYSGDPHAAARDRTSGAAAGSVPSSGAASASRPTSGAAGSDPTSDAVSTRPSAPTSGASARPGDPTSGSASTRPSSTTSGAASARPSAITPDAACAWPSAADADFDRDVERSQAWRCLDAVRTKVQPLTYQAFDLYVLKGWRPEQVAEALGIDRAAVYVAKSRVLAAARRQHERLMAQGEDE